MHQILLKNIFQPVLQNVILYSCKVLLVLCDWKDWYYIQQKSIQYKSDFMIQNINVFYFKIFSKYSTKRENTFMTVS